MPKRTDKRTWPALSRRITSESTWLDRRQLVAAMGLSTIGVTVLPAIGHAEDPVSDITWDKVHERIYPAKKNRAFTARTIADRKVTPRELATRYNNFYEFTATKDEVWEKVGDFAVRPWTVQVHGLVSKPREYGLDDLVKRFRLEERVYRFRCVEAWAMTVPWTGFPLARLLAEVEPKAEAKFVRFVTAERRDEMPGLRRSSWYPWPYHEALRLDEAMHDLTLLATGIYGRPLPRQCGAPIRLVVPWKYGYKSIKSIVEIELTDEQPRTFWNHMSPREYSFLSNVDPDKPHPRWSQATERILGLEDRVPTLPFNGYAEQVAGLYETK